MKFIWIIRKYSFLGGQDTPPPPLKNVTPTNWSTLQQNRSRILTPLPPPHNTRELFYTVFCHRQVDIPSGVMLFLLYSTKKFKKITSKLKILTINYCYHLKIDKKLWIQSFKVRLLEKHFFRIFEIFFSKGNGE